MALLKPEGLFVDSEKRRVRIVRVEYYQLFVNEISEDQFYISKRELAVIYLLMYAMKKTFLQ